MVMLGCLDVRMVLFAFMFSHSAIKHERIYVVQSELFSCCVRPLEAIHSATEYCS